MFISAYHTVVHLYSIKFFSCTLQHCSCPQEAFKKTRDLPIQCALCSGVSLQHYTIRFFTIASQSISWCKYCSICYANLAFITVSHSVNDVSQIFCGLPKCGCSIYWFQIVNMCVLWKFLLFCVGNDIFTDLLQFL